jgi:hypothetical protein
MTSALLASFIHTKSFYPSPVISMCPDSRKNQPLLFWHFFVSASVFTFMLSCPPCSIHYHRIHPAYWKDRLQRVQALGLNTVQVRILPIGVNSYIGQQLSWIIHVMSYCPRWLIRA